LIERFSWFQKTLFPPQTLVEKGVPHDYSNLITLFISKGDFHNPNAVGESFAEAKIVSIMIDAVGKSLYFFNPD
jgi:hypothetical protein